MISAFLDDYEEQLDILQFVHFNQFEPSGVSILISPYHDNVAVLPVINPL